MPRLSGSSGNPGKAVLDASTIVALVATEEHSDWAALPAGHASVGSHKWLVAPIRLFSGKDGVDYYPAWLLQLE